VTAASESPLEDPLLEERPLEDPPLEELLLEEPLLEELPPEEPLLDVAPPDPPPDAPSGAAPSLDSMGYQPGELVPQAGTRGAVTSAKPQVRTGRACILGGQAIPMPCSRMREMPGLGVKNALLVDIAV
jgi:hypothetical protein